ncbi:hypothetical protein [uncultured Psychromonas sp.]|uniref:hypothetical protein n=1 Tax=uncultured Psychromonas sp. TaxID=173974 RepID=UPI002630AA3D|nr:hypothetical protein [uncultured Psychromonas sp.]
MINTNTPLSRSYLFRLIFVIGLTMTVISLYYCVDWKVIAKNCEIFDSFECSKSLASSFFISKLIATATLTSLGFWALIFRSEQTTHQIKITLDNNTFNNFVSHKKEFIELLVTFEDINKCSINNKSMLYEKFFAQNNPTNMNFSCDAQEATRLIELNTSEQKKFIKRISQIKGKKGIQYALSRFNNALMLHYGISMNEWLEYTTEEGEQKVMPEAPYHALRVCNELFGLIALYSEKNEISVQLLEASQENFLENQHKISSRIHELYFRKWTKSYRKCEKPNFPYG